MVKWEGANPIQVVGRACRLPGATSVAQFWENMAAGRCTVQSIGDDRWPLARFLDRRRGQPGKTYTFAAGVIERVWDFDAAAFGISPREAVQLDPQQRLALQLVWEALEDALIPTSRLAGRHVGVYAGASALDYSTARMFDSANADAYFMIGNTLSLISNRVSHAFDLRGPSLTIDTACSSSLVALHHAAEALNAGRVEMAIVVGVNLLLSPFPFVGFAQASMLSPDGLCRSFDAGANGYVRAEGGAALILKKASFRDIDAPRNYASIVATGVNSDGHTIGVSLPSSVGQARLLEEVYGRAGIPPDVLAFAEAHGTGTRAGDPVEAQALGQVLGRHRNQPLPIGSVKSNIGHLEPASGVAGLMKAMLALEHDLLPATLHAGELNPDIPFDDLNLSVARRSLPLERTGSLRAAAVSSFGFGGTNAHAVIADPVSSIPAPSRPRARGVAGSAKREDSTTHGLIVLSGATENTVRALARAHQGSTSEGAPDTALLAGALGHFRELMPERAAILVTAPEDLSRACGALADGIQDPMVVRGRAIDRRVKTAFVFSGNGSQWAGMGRAALAANPSFRSKLEEIDRLFLHHADWSLIDALGADDLETRLKSASVAQPLLFAIQVASSAALAQMGLEPDLVFGHSVGEVAAAHVAGALPLDVAVSVIVARSTHQELARGLGAMAALRLGEQAARASIAQSGVDEIEIAAINSVRSVTVVGTRTAVAEYADFAAREGVGCKVLDLDYPFHSQLLKVCERPLMASLKGMRAKRGRIPFVSTVTGEHLTGSQLGSRYWWRNVRDPVQFAAAVASAQKDGVQLFMEIGPKPILQGYLAECFGESGSKAGSIPSLEIGDGEIPDPVRKALALAVTRGAKVDSERAFGPRPVKPFDLPTYAWQNATYRPPTTVEALGGLSPLETHHPLLGWRGLAEDPAWHVHIDAENLPWLHDHKVSGQVVFPGAGFAEMALAAARRLFREDGVELRDMSIVQPLILREGESSEVRILYSSDSSTVEIGSRPRLSDQAFQVHAFCRLAKLPSATPPVSQLPTQGSHEAMDAEAVYGAAAAFGLDYGPAFRRIVVAQKFGSSRVAMSFASLPEEEDANSPFGLHPADLDAAFHGLFVAAENANSGNADRMPLVPVRLGQLRLYSPGRRAARAELIIRRATSHSAQADVLLFDAGGGCIASLHDARFSAMRLVPQSKLSDLAYHETSEAVFTPRDEKYSPGIRGRLGECIGRFKQSETQAGVDDEPRFLLEAAARRIAYDKVARSAGSDGIIALQTDGTANAKVLRRLLMTLEAEGLAEEHADGGWRLHSCEIPPAADLLRTVLAEHPAWSADCVLLTRASVLLDARLVPAPDEASAPSYSPATLDHFFAGSPRFAAATRALVETVLDLVSRWEAARPLRLCIVGLQGGFARKIVDTIHPGSCRLLLVDSDKRLIDRARLSYAARADVAVLDLATALDGGQLGRHDLVVSPFGLSYLPADRDFLPRIASLLVPDGALLAVEASPDAFHDVVFGLQPGWFARSLDPEFPIGALRTSDEWKDALAGAGLSDPEAAGLGAESASSALLLAGAPRNTSGKDVEVAGRRSAAMPPAVEVSASGAASFADLLARELSALGKAVTRADPSHRRNGNGAKHGNGNGNGRAVHNGNGAHGIREITLGAAPRGKAREVVWVAAPPVDDDQTSALLCDRIAELTNILGQGASVSRLWIIVPGGARANVDLGSASPGQSGLWAAARTAANEYADTDIRLVDIEEGLGEEAAAEHMAGLVSEPPADREVVVARTGVAALRIRRGVRDTRASHENVARDQTKHRAVLDQVERGSLETLGWTCQPLALPGPHEVQIEVAATGLNFRDVMWGMGLLPDEALEAGFAGQTLGFECSGVVAAVGSSVDRINVGDPVVALAPQAFASHVTVAAHAVVPLPASIDLEAAASIPVAFLTAYYALHHLARIQAGEWVLVHGGAGGVGLAALQIARWRGARVIATAGSDEKRNILTLLGAEHVLSSRSLEFVDQVHGITGGGVDVVLNSLSGEAMERSLELLKPFGRFLELGKRDFYANTKIGVRPFRQNTSYFGIDADQLLSQQPKLAANLMGDLMGHFAEGAFTPLAHRTFEAKEIVDAFRLMQQSGHVGKIIVRPPLPASLPAPSPERPFSASADGAHLIIGGLGGFGLATAEWLADRGARTLVLIGRRKAADDVARQQIEKLRSRGVDVRVMTCDATDPVLLDGMLCNLRNEMSIKGVVHAAMVLDDALMRNLDHGRIARVLRSKIDIGVNLDRLTRSDDLDYFWLFSSITTVIGNPGQVAYVAGNAALEGLARVRRSAGRPALAVRWGAIEDVGVLARERDKVADLARRAGATGLKAREALDLLGRAIGDDDRSPERAVVTLAAMNWSEARAQLALLRTPLFQDLRGASDASPVAAINLADAIAGRDDSSARDVVARHLAGELSAILRMPADDLNWHRPLAELGLDSLMAVELRLAATRRLGIELPLASIADGASISSVADKVVSRLRTAAGPADPARTADLELAKRHVDAPLDEDQLERVTREIGERAAASDRIIP